MGKDMSNVDSASVEMADDNESELVASDVKDDVFADFIHLSPEQQSQLAKVGPLALLGQAIPHIKRQGGRRMQSGKVQ